VFCHACVYCHEARCTYIMLGRFSEHRGLSSPAYSFAMSKDAAHETLWAGPGRRNGFSSVGKDCAPSPAGSHASYMSQPTGIVGRSLEA